MMIGLVCRIDKQDKQDLCISARSWCKKIKSIFTHALSLSLSLTSLYWVKDGPECLFFPSLPSALRWLVASLILEKHFSMCTGSMSFFQSLPSALRWLRWLTRWVHRAHTKLTTPCCSSSLKFAHWIWDSTHQILTKRQVHRAHICVFLLLWVVPIETAPWKEW